MYDTFRKVYRPLHESNAKLIVELKERFEKVEEILLKVKSREMSLALTNLEQSSMWATKAIVLADESNGGNQLLMET